MSIERQGYERDYFVCGWLGTFAVMQAARESDKVAEKSKTGSAMHLLRACESIDEDREAFLEDFQRFANSYHTNQNNYKVKWGERLAILDENGSLSKEFIEAYDLFCDPERMEKLLATSDIGRLADSLAFYKEYFAKMGRVYTPIDLRTLSHFIEYAHREIDFYIGLEDPARKVAS